MSKPKISHTGIINRIKNLKITQAYAQYKMRSAGDLDNDLINWNYNLTRRIQKEEFKEEDREKNTHSSGKH